MRTLQRRLVRVAAAAVAVVGWAALPTGAKASLIGDMITVEATICSPCTDTVPVVDPTAEFTLKRTNNDGNQEIIEANIRYDRLWVRSTGRSQCVSGDFPNAP